MKRIILAQFIILLIGTLFAWGNFLVELITWLRSRQCLTGCTLTEAVNPFLTSCFYGALVFTCAFILNIILKKASKQANV